jgi:hypothetical protein
VLQVRVEDAQVGEKNKQWVQRFGILNALVQKLVAESGRNVVGRACEIAVH